MIKKIFCTTALVLSSVSNAGHWSDPLTIEELWTEGESDIIGLTTTGGKEYATGCLADLWLIKANSDGRRGRQYSTLLAAQTANKKVRLWHTDDCGSWSFHQATAVKILK